jgi:hypothetical protein
MFMVVQLSITKIKKIKSLPGAGFFIVRHFLIGKEGYQQFFFHGIIVATQAFRQQTIGQQPTAQAKRTKTGMLVR